MYASFNCKAHSSDIAIFASYASGLSTRPNATNVWKDVQITTANPFVFVGKTDGERIAASSSRAIRSELVSSS